MDEQQTPICNKPITEEGINPIALAKAVWNGRRTIILSLIICSALGLIISLVSRREYTASTVMVPQLGGDVQSKLGSIGSLAALAGINMDMSQSTELSPMIYPQIANSIPFQLELMNTPLNFQGYPQPITLFDYYINYGEKNILGSILKYTIGLPGIIRKAIKGKPKEIILPNGIGIQPIMLTEDQYKVIKLVGEQISLDVNAKEGYLTLSTRMPEPLVAAQLTIKELELLQRYITAFKIEKVKANLSFIQERYDETKAEFEKAQLSLAIINDRNKDFTSGLSKIESDRIQTRYTIAFSVFQELAKQLEQAKIQVKKETPVFAIIQPVTIPSLTDGKPSKSMIIIICTLLGGIIGLMILFGKQLFSNLKQKWSENSD